MRIRKIEDDFDYNFKRVIKEMRGDFQELSSLNSDDFQDYAWNNEEMCKYFTRKMFERAFEYGGDEMFEEGEE